MQLNSAYRRPEREHESHDFVGPGNWNGIQSWHGDDNRVPTTSRDARKHCLRLYFDGDSWHNACGRAFRIIGPQPLLRAEMLSCRGCRAVMRDRMVVGPDLYEVLGIIGRADESAQAMVLDFAFGEQNPNLVILSLLADFLDEAGNAWAEFLRLEYELQVFGQEMSPRRFTELLARRWYVWAESV